MYMCIPSVLYVSSSFPTIILVPHAFSSLLYDGARVGVVGVAYGGDDVSPVGILPAFL